MHTTVFEITLHHGLDSEHADSALSVRHAIETDMVKQGLMVGGGGMGHGIMDISVDSTPESQDYIAHRGQEIIASYGLKCTFRHFEHCETGDQ